MFVDIMNAFEPVQFLMDSPLWVSFIVPGVALAVALAIIVVLGELVAEELAVALVVPAVLGSLFGVPVILSEVFRHAGVHMGFPLV